MDEERFDRLSRVVGDGTTRRGVLGLLAGVAGAGLSETAAKRRHRGRRKGQRRAQAAKTEKITLCHKGKTLQVPFPAAPAHLGHGDTMGACDGAGNPQGCQVLRDFCGLLAGPCCSGFGMVCVPFVTTPVVTTCQRGCSSDSDCSVLGDGYICIVDLINCTFLGTKCCAKRCNSASDCPRGQQCCNDPQGKVCRLICNN